MAKAPHNMPRFKRPVSGYVGATSVGQWFEMDQVRPALAWPAVRPTDIALMSPTSNTVLNTASFSVHIFSMHSYDVFDFDGR
jgi:hypothetical protein